MKVFIVGFIAGIIVTYACLWVLSPYIVAWMLGWGNRV